MSTCKNLLFDLGNVLLDIDLNNVRKAFIALGVKDIDTHFTQLNAADVFNRYETGKITTAEFCHIIQQQSEVSLTEQDVHVAWNAILKDFRKDTIDHILSLKSKYRIFLLSNTNAMHLDLIHAKASAQLGLNKLDDLFEKAYYSHLMGLRKPEKEIYQFVLDDAGIESGETLFIDDLEPNIKAAAGLGFQTHLLKEGERVEQVIF